MAKLTLIANPTFKAKVEIPLAGGEKASVEMTFKHRTKSALDEFIKTREGKSDVDTFLEMVEGWDLEDEFDRESVELLLENHLGAPMAVFSTYIEQLLQARIKN